MPCPTFGDLAKPASEVIGDDYTSKFTMKAKVAPKLGLPGLSATLDNELKEKGLDPKISFKYVEPSTGISFDKLMLKGTAWTIDASKLICGVKCKASCNPADPASGSLAADYKTKESTVTVKADKKVIKATASAAPFSVGIFGFSLEYPVAGGDVALAAGANATVNGVFGSCVYTAKKVFQFGFMYAPMPDLSCALTADSSGPDSAVLGLKWTACPNLTSLSTKTSATGMSVVAVKKLAKDASIVVSAALKYADMTAKPTLGCSLTIG
eukprot:CAMPEP_0119266476 /NCGR_PEP_ID=MMETSP1329-20130426/4956_1 /TAXON_ID=114041 /ORGANISM="Genus nov. species nov., Strain RCC1024" /LENGTH=267 /DNA_ID=CAMNT_0007266357 /DNA_START=50 /DNA_END=853 /DNA_ORIENTATION=-